MPSSILISLISAIILSILLIKAAGWIIAASSKLARHFKISEYSISFLVIAFATSLPELVVGILSSAEKKTTLALGNVIGSNIADLTIILAIPLLVGGAISTKKLIQNKDLTFTAVLGLLPIALMLDGLLSRFDGVLLIVCYIVYILIFLKRSNIIENIIERMEHTHVLKELVVLAIGIGTLLLSANFLVRAAESISIAAGVPLIFVGLTVTALGTSLPELAFGLKAIRTRHKGEVIGNVLGSVIANSTIVLGVGALIEPVQKSPEVSSIGLGFLVLIIISFLTMSLTKKEISKLEAVFLILLYIGFVIAERFFS